MRASHVAFVGTMLLVPLGCDDNDNVTVGPTSTGGSDMGTGSDMSTPPSAQIRIAHLSPNKPPFDVCLAARGSGQFNGPLLKPAGVVATGLAYAQVSKYLSVAPGPYDLRVVDGGDTTCAHSLFDATNLPALTTGGSYTIAGIGFIPPRGTDPTAFTVVVYTDDSVNAVNAVLLRFIQAAPHLAAVDFGTGAGSSFAVLFANVGYPQAGTSTSPASDVNGYVSLSPPSPPVTFSLRMHGSTTDALTVTIPTAPAAGAVISVFAIGDVSGLPRPLQALVCADNAATGGPLSPCALLP
jgi:hypothetical protein